MNSFWVQLGLVIAITVGTAGIVEHVKKASEHPKSARARGWFFFLAGTCGLLFLPLVAINVSGDPQRIFGLWTGSWFPFLIGLYFMLSAARALRGDTPYWQVFKEYRQLSRTSANGSLEDKALLNEMKKKEEE